METLKRSCLTSACVVLVMSDQSRKALTLRFLLQSSVARLFVSRPPGDTYRSRSRCDCPQKILETSLFLFEILPALFVKFLMLDPVLQA